MICRLNIFILFLLSTMISSCTQDAYDKGEGKYSQMRGDFVEAQIDASKQIVSITTDDDEMLPLVNPYSANWITKGDTLYRCMLYYNKVETAKGKYAAEVLSVGQVPCPSLKHWADFKEKYRTDPVKFESLWLSKSGKYLNLYMLLKTGVTEDTTAVHRLAFISDTIMVNNDESSNETKTYVITKVTDTSIDLTVPEVGMGGMMTIPSFSVKNIPLVKSDDNTMGRLISYSGTVVGANGAEKAYKVGDVTVLFNDKTVVVKFSLMYGNMPFAMLTTFTGKRQ